MTAYPIAAAVIEIRNSAGPDTCSIYSSCTFYLSRKICLQTAKDPSKAFLPWMGSTSLLLAVRTAVHYYDPIQDAESRTIHDGLDLQNGHCWSTLSRKEKESYINDLEDTIKTALIMLAFETRTQIAKKYYVRMPTKKIIRKLEDHYLIKWRLTDPITTVYNTLINGNYQSIGKRKKPHRKENHNLAPLFLLNS